MTTPPAISGSSGTSMALAANPRWSSQTAIVTAAATTTMNSVFQISSVTRIRAISTSALAMDTGTLRPARPWSRVGAGGSMVMAASCLRHACVIVVAGLPGEEVERSDLEQLGLLVLEQLVDGVGVGLGHRVEAL